MKLFISNGLTNISSNFKSSNFSSKMQFPKNQLIINEYLSQECKFISTPLF